MWPATNGASRRYPVSTHSAVKTVGGTASTMVEIWWVDLRFAAARCGTVPVGAICPPHLVARAHCHPDALAPGPEGVSPLLSCELVEGTTISSCFSACQRCQRHRSGGLELPCDSSHLPSVHDMGSIVSRPVLIFRTILNQATNGFVTAVSRVILGGKWQT